MKTIILLDMDAFFASVEQASNPMLRGKPVIVCGEGRSVATAVSYEARKYGIKTGMSVVEAKRLCGFLIPVIGNMDKYVQASLDVQQILLAVTPLVEVFSIDECFADISESVKKGASAYDICKNIQKSIYDKLKITCSIGISSNKQAAKVASKLNKPAGVTELYPEKFREMSKNTDIKNLAGAGVGRKVSRKLKLLGINTVYDLSKANISMLKSYFGINAHYLKKLACGEGDDLVREYARKETEKSVSNSRTMPKDSDDISDDINVVKAYLRMICEMTAFRLRKKGLKASNVFLGIRYGDFTHYGAQKRLDEHISDTKLVYEECVKILGGYTLLKNP